MGTYQSNSVNYNTDHSKITSFKDFNPKAEEKELKKVKNSFKKNDNNVDKLANQSKFKFNKVTRKMDDLPKDYVEDKLDAVKESLRTDVVQVTIPTEIENYMENLGIPAEKHAEVFSNYIDHLLGTIYGTELESFTDWTDESDNISDYIG